MQVRNVQFAFACTLLSVLPLCAQTQSGDGTALQGPPVAPVRNVIDDYFGTKVDDPYRYLENLKDPEVESWFKAQNAYTRATLARIPGRAKLAARIRELDQSAPRVFAHRLPDNEYLIWKRLPNEDTGKVYVRKGLHGADRLLVDPEKIMLNAEDESKGKKEVDNWAVSADGKLMVVLITPGGSETNSELRVIEIATGREFPDAVAHGACAEGLCVSWLPDNHSFVYGRLQDLPADAPPEQVRQKFRVYLHVLGTDSEKDKPVFGAGVVRSIDVDPSLIASLVIPLGSKYAIGVLNGSVTPNSAYYVAPVATLDRPDTPWRKINDFGDGVTDVAVHGDDLYLLTYKDTPRYKVMRLDIRKPDLVSAETIVPAGRAVVTGLHRASDALYVDLMDGGVGRLLRVPYGSSPKVESVALPLDGSIYVDSDPQVDGIMFFATSWTNAGKIYAYDAKTKQVTDTGIQPAGPFDDPGNLESVEVNVSSYDGTEVPLSIAYKRGLKKDGTNPTLMEGYGGYSVSITPSFNPMQQAWYERGGVLAFCHVRGGGEYGEEWHLGGKGATKPNTWLDFIACAQYLIDKKYTSTPRLAGMGGSAGGILIGRAITERPDLFGAAIIEVGVLDTVRFEHSTNGETNIPELGTVNTEDGFKNIYQMSSYHHVRDHTAYPAVLLTTGSNDPRVDPWLPGKMTARLQAATSSGKPVLLEVDYGGGHGGGSGEHAQEEMLADRYSFLLWQFGVEGFQP